MEFILQTAVTVEESTIKIKPSDKITMVGSCFAENIGTLMTKGGLNSCINPFGIMYNPSSVANTLLLIINKKTFTDNDIFEQQGVFKSYAFHSRYASINPKECIEQMNRHCRQATEFLQTTDKLIITLGTAFAFRLKTTQQIVANCHKTPSENFERILLNPEEIIQQWSSCIKTIRTINPDLPIIFTVSPIRHLRDGLHENQISKSILHYAIYKIQQSLHHIYYFPAYEIIIDQLRDYRFYAEDMTHPSALAIQYIWEKFRKAWCSEECNTMISEMTEIHKAVLHQWQHPTKLHIEPFVTLHLQKLNRLQQKYPHLNLEKEYNHFNTLLLTI